MYDLEFELLITHDNYKNIRFLQNKPEKEKKNIIIKPTIKKHYIDKKYIKIDGSAMHYNYGNNRISYVYKVEKQIEKVKNTELSINEMKEFILEIKEEMKLLIKEIERVQSIKIKSEAYPIKKYGTEDTENSYGEFEHFNELIDRI